MKNWIIQHYKNNNYPIDKLILFGIRNEENYTLDMFNDLLGFIYDDKIYFSKGTTDPGIYYTKNPMNSKGAFHLNLGFHRKMWVLDKHAGKYLALCNRWNCKKQNGWRDNNKNFENDDGIKVSGHFGANWHYTNNDEFIKLASAGCQVTNDIKFFNKSIECAIASEQEFFSYILFDIKEIPVNLLIESTIFNDR